MRAAACLLRRQHTLRVRWVPPRSRPHAGTHLRRLCLPGGARAGGRTGPTAREQRPHHVRSVGAASVFRSCMVGRFFVGCTSPLRVSRSQRLTSHGSGCTSVVLCLISPAMLMPPPPLPRLQLAYIRCASLCAADAGCASFDFTSRAQPDACRLFGADAVRVEGGGAESRKFCSEKGR